MSSSKALEIRELVKQYDKGTVIGPVSFSVKKGEFVSLLGPSGCGKTTILRCVTGFERVTSGNIFLSDADITKKPAHLRGVGLVFQSYALFPHLTVFENIAFGLRLQHISKSEIQDRVQRYLEIVSLGSMENRMPTELSGGQQQRVAIARSLVMQPEILLLDEPLSNLDQKLRLQMRLELKSIQRRTGTTFIYVTHDQGEALAMSDRVIILSAGKLEQTGTPSEVYGRPRSRFVADFIGASNIYTGTVVKHLSSSIVEIETDSGATMLATCQEHMATGTGVWVCIRPENIEHVTAKHTEKTPDATIWHGKLTESTYSGDRTEVRLAIATPPGKQGPPPSLSFFVTDPGSLPTDIISVSFGAKAAIAVRATA